MVGKIVSVNLPNAPETPVYVMDKIPVPVEVNVAGPQHIGAGRPMMFRESYVGVVVKEESDSFTTSDAWRVADPNLVCFFPEQLVKLLDVNVQPRPATRPVEDYIQVRSFMEVEDLQDPLDHKDAIADHLLED